MPGLDIDFITHKLPTNPNIHPIKQKPRHLRLEWSLALKEEIQKQLDAGFLLSVQYPQWLANIVSVPKKDDKVRMCIDYRDLNKASPKDDFSLPHIDVLIDSTFGHEMMSFMDRFSSYNQIKMLVEVWEKTIFHAPLGHILL